MTKFIKSKEEKK